MNTNETEQSKEKSVAPPHARIHWKGAEVTVLGTAHVSPESVRDVEEYFKDLSPHVVCVELCESRYETMSDPDRWRNLDLSSVIKQKKLGLLFSSLILSSFQKKIGETTGVRPGEEMMRSCELAEKNERVLVMADREIRTTLSRAWGRVGFFSKLWLASNLVASLLVREEVEPEEIERMKREDVLTDLFSSLPARYDEVKRVIVDERDMYLAQKIRESVEKHGDRAGGEALRILAVVGAGHLKGIERILKEEEPVELEPLCVVPKKKPTASILAWSGISLVFLMLSWYVGLGGWSAFQNSLLAWVLGRSIGSGVGAILARAHPLTILVTVVTAPFSIFIFGSRLWMFSSLTELKVRKPRVEDFENIASDTETLRGFFRSLYSNRVLKLFWIITLVSLGLTVGNLHFLGIVLDGIVGRFF